MSSLQGMLMLCHVAATDLGVGLGEAKAWPPLVALGSANIKSESVLGPLLSLVEVFTSYGALPRPACFHHLTAPLP